MKSITQRELRNDNAQVIRAVEAGESFLVTKNGVSVAVLRPVLPSEKEAGLPLGRPARRRVRYAEQPRVTGAVPTGQILEELRGER
ncbi:type II toxin-antitoxin system Phd/YefM family antitoxin [Specibacter cremeus]|uniref:type II toxin-antitoxin system Phd/YefM family antitoxin n=1 Tax=Specibacter cremeus TaxID=1629051 RepID=UPI000F79E7FE|nr:type II toxin-antitoxin system prevent-host-death family antitoxin [Specibacter cremeus]